MALENELNIALEAVRAAGMLTNDIQDRIGADDVVSKDDRSPVTIADFGSQAVIVHHLNKAFPNDAIVGEEDDQAVSEDEDLRQRILTYTRAHSPVASDEDLLYHIGLGSGAVNVAERYWTVDPIDGTKGFLRGDHYAVALALIEQGEVVLGVLGCPTLQVDMKIPNGEKGCLFYGVKNKGTYVRSFSDAADRSVTVDQIQDASQAVLCESVESGHVSHTFHDQVLKRLGITAQPFRIDSQCKYAAVARGLASIYLRRSSSKGYREKIWDHAAGCMVVSEAGGRVTDFQGDALDFSGETTLPDRNGIVVTNGHIHDEVVAAIQQTLSAM